MQYRRKSKICKPKIFITFLECKQVICFLDVWLKPLFLNGNFNYLKIYQTLLFTSVIVNSGKNKK